MTPLPDFSAHRTRLLSRLDDDEAVLLFGAPPRVRSGTSEYRYRPDSDVYWLTGWEDPEVVAFLRPGEEPLTLFVQPRDPERETWEGRRPGPDGAKEQFGADAAFPIASLPDELPRLLQGVGRLHHAFGRDADHDALVVGSIAGATRAARRNGLSVPETFHALSWLLHELRLFKQPDELEVIRHAAALSGVAHRRAMALAAPGVRECAIEADFVATILAEGSTGPGYVPIVAGGNHATVLHYTTNRDTLRDGQLLLLDGGGEHCYYTVDITRTFPVDGRFTSPQRAVYEHVLEAQRSAIEAARPGHTLNDVHDTAVRRLVEGLIDLGLIEGPVDDRIEDGAFRRWYMHGTSHWLGLDVHDVGAYGRRGEPRRLEPGMVITVEPGLYFPENDEQVPPELRGIGVRIEDDVLITPQGSPEVLTEGVPKEVHAVEEACQVSL